MSEKYLEGQLNVCCVHVTISHFEASVVTNLLISIVHTACCLVAGSLEQVVNNL